ncbi:MAG: glutamine-hydrolyzing GMP synthase [Acidobacteriota bacterium]
MKHAEKILIMDFGSQYTQLIARRVREARVYCEISRHDLPLESILKEKPAGIILSGGPDSVYREGSPSLDLRILDLGIPVLGICYGMQIIARMLGGTVERGKEREYGKTEIKIIRENSLYRGLDEIQIVWMSHGDRVKEVPKKFTITSRSESNPVVSIADYEKKIFGIQFHPEVNHTENGMTMIRNFLFGVCACRADWNMAKFLEDSVRDIQEKVGKGKVICALSGGVDSAVTALLVHRAIGERLTCIFVDNGLLRKNEAEELLNRFRMKFHLNVQHVDASNEFLNALQGVDDPEQKRRIIGNKFIEIFEREADKIGDLEFLAQGTIYPDRIESSSVKGPSAVIKTHHNVGGLPEEMTLNLVEPLSELFKDEVRRLGIELGLDAEFLKRHPFPGPGLAVRIIGEVTVERAKVLQEADAIFIEELKKSGLYDQVSQAFAVLLPIRTVGVMGDARTYENVLALRAVHTLDFMTADWFGFPHDFLRRVSTRIVNEVRGVNRVVYDISTKPPSTVEWE